MHTNNKIFLAFLLSFFVYQQSFSQTLRADSNLVEGRLDNGLHYYIYHSTKDKEHTSMQLIVRAGSLQENEQQLGLAHFVEHMAFNGTRKYPENKLIRVLEEMGVKFGAHLNAHTSHDETVYKLAVNTKNESNLITGLDIFREWAGEVTFDSLEIEKERGVVIEEWRARQGSERRLSEQYLPLIFKDSKYADRTPIGKVSILENFARQTLVDYYETWYRPNLMAITVVSDADPSRIETLIKEKFSDLKNKSVDERVFYHLPAHQDTLYAVLTDKEANNVSFSAFKKIPSFDSINNESVFLEAMKRGFYNNLARNRFARLIQQDASFKSGSSSMSDLLLKNGVFSGGASLASGQVEKGIKQYLVEMQRIAKFGFTTSEIEDYKKQYIAQVERSAQSEYNPPASILLERLKNYYYKGDVPLTSAERTRLTKKYIHQLDSASVHQFLLGYQNPGSMVILLTGPERLKKELPNQKLLSQWFQEVKTSPKLTPWSDDEFVPAKLLKEKPQPATVLTKEDIEAINVEKWRLSNGVNVYFKESDERKDYIQLTGFRAGGIYSLDSSQYISALYSKNMVSSSGAGEFTRNALSKYLLGNSASATMVLSTNREGVAASSHMDDVETLFQLLHLKWTRPILDTAIFERNKKRAFAQVKKQKHQVGYEFSKKIGNLLRGGNEFIGDITEERIENELDFDQVLNAYISRFKSAKGFDFVIVGDFKSEEIKEYVLQYLGGLPSGPIDSEYKYKGTQVSKSAKEQLIAYDGTTPRASVSLYFQHDNPVHEYPALLRQELLQEVLKVKLRNNLREENSGVYGVGVSMSSTRFPSPLIRTRVNFTCDPENVDFLIREARIEIEKVANDPSYFIEELANIKKQQITSYEMQQMKNTFWSSNLRNHIYYGFNSWDFFTNYKEMLEQIKPEEISAFAKQYILESSEVEAILMPKSHEN